MNGGLTALGAKLVPDRDGTAIADLIWACLRGLTLPQLVSPTSYETTRQRRALIDVLTLYLSAEALFDRR
jgi:hypothetical protein